MALGELDPPPGEVIIACVHLEGVSAVSESDVLDAIDTHSDPLEINGPKPLLDWAVLVDDARRIESYYAAQGYFEARVLDYKVEEIEPGSVRVTFQVKEGEPTIVRRVYIYGLDDPLNADDEVAAELLSDVRDDAAKLVKVREGRVWQEADYLMSLSELERELKEQGFAFAQAIGETRVMRATREAEVRIAVVPGPVARVASVHVRGNRHVSEERVLRRVDIDDGDVADQGLLDDTERDVFGLGAFYAATVQVEGPERRTLVGAERSVRALMEQARDIPERIAVGVNLQERPVMDGQVGVGAGVETKRGEVYALAAFGHRNLFGGLQRLNLEARPALILLPSLFQPDIKAPGVRISAGFQQPSFIEEHILASLDTSYELGVEYGYRYHQVDGAVSLSRSLWERLVLELGYSLSYTAFFDYSASLKLPVTRTLGLEFRESYLVTELFQNLVYDGRDDPLDAQNGVYLAVGAAQSLEALGSDFHYIRFTTEGRVYGTFWGRVTLAMRAKFGQVFNVFGGDVPLSGRFRGGGPTDMRGFSSGRMGPFLCRLADGSELVSNDDDSCDGDKVFIGGKLVALGSIETRFLLGAGFSLAAFVDVGEIWSTPHDVDFGGINVAVGPGVRYQTPFGPIRLDFGFLVSEGKDPPWVFHLSIGQAF